jgi:hypothetical protein
MTEDHVFIDALDGRLAGREAMIDAWTQYFAMVPDYWIRVENMLSSDGTVVAFGRAGGTFAPGRPIDPSRRWEIPAAWRAEVRGDRVAVWQVYADNLPIRRLMGVEKT